ncbi:MAG TPA: cell division protein CrgA [Acidimicrobiales bacterium]|nr:cell division protein CrgA [Acidimicrobiales bacterium]
MAKPTSGKRTPPRQGGSGRTTPKGSNSKGRAPASSGRYTPPIPKEKKVSPRWVPALMFFLLLSGAAIILLNYLSLLPGDADNRYLLVGLALITGGFITATRYH